MDVNDLKEAVKEKCAEELTHCSATKLSVYKVGTVVPIHPEETQGLMSWNEVPKDTMGENPFIVVAPQAAAASAGDINTDRC